MSTDTTVSVTETESIEVDHKSLVRYTVLEATIEQSGRSIKVTRDRDGDYLVWASNFEGSRDDYFGDDDRSGWSAATPAMLAEMVALSGRWEARMAAEPPREPTEIDRLANEELMARRALERVTDDVARAAYNYQQGVPRVQAAQATHAEIVARLNRARAGA